MKRLVPYLLLSLLLLPGVLLAQDTKEKRYPQPQQHTLSVSLNGGMGGILINGSFRKPTTYGGALGMDVLYTQAVSPCWGLQVGLGFQYVTGAFGANVQSTGYKAPIPVTDGIGYHDEDARFVCRLDDIHEFYTMPMLQIPLRVTFFKKQWYAAGGVKLGMPVGMTAHYEYSDCQVGITEVMGTGTALDEFLPLYSFDPASGKYRVGGFGSMLSVAASFEAGYRFVADNKETLIVSLYADYGLNQIHAGCEKEEPLLSIRDGEPIYSNCMQSDLISGFRYLSAGARMTYQFGFGREAGYRKMRHRRPVNILNIGRVHHRPHHSRRGIW